MIFALLLSVAGVLVEPVAPASRAIVLDADGAAWIVIDHVMPRDAKIVELIWPVAEPGIDLSSARLVGCTPEGAVAVLERCETTDAVQWKLFVDTAAEKSVARLAARLPELRVEWQHLVVVNGGEAEWVLAAAMSGWKGTPAEDVGLLTPFGRCDGLSLLPELTQTVAVWSVAKVPAKVALRWDSRDGRETASRVVVFERDLHSEFGRRVLPSGRVTLQTPTRRLVQDFPGAAPGTRVELQAGDAPGILVRRLKAASTQVDVRTDANRRLAAFTERIEYEYAVSNALAEPVELELVEHPARGWEVVKASAPWQKRDADTLVFTVSVPPRGQEKVTAVVLRRNQTPA